MPIVPPLIAKPSNATSVESPINTTMAFPPDASLMVAPVLPFRVSRLNPLITTFSVQVPLIIRVFGTIGLSSLSAPLIVVTGPFPPQNTGISAPRALIEKASRQPKAIAKTLNLETLSFIYIPPIKLLTVDPTFRRSIVSVDFMTFSFVKVRTEFERSVESKRKLVLWLLLAGGRALTLGWPSLLSKATRRCLSPLRVRHPPYWIQFSV